MQLPRQIPIGPIRADEAGDCKRAAVSEQLRDLGDAADVFFAVFRAEAEVLVEAEPDVVAVEAVRGDVVGLAKECLLERNGDGGFT
jgi:hypothetical protein